MSFDFFDNKEAADIIIINGRIYTQDPDLPWTEAAACRQGKITAVGGSQEILSLKEEGTDVLDLEGAYMLPGLIDTDGSPVTEVFEDSCLRLYDDMDTASVLDSVEFYASEHPEMKTVLAWGYDTGLEERNSSDDMKKRLDRISADRPVILLSEDGMSAWMNTVCGNMAESAAAGDMAEIMTMPYLLSILDPFDCESMRDGIAFQTEKYSSRGYTAISNSGSPGFLSEAYNGIMASMIHDGSFRQRFYDSFSVSRKMNPRFVHARLTERRNLFTETSGLAAMRTLRIYAKNKSALSERYIRTLCSEAAASGCDIEISCDSREILFCMCDIIKNINKKYRKKLFFTFVHNEALDDEERKNCFSEENISEAASSAPDNRDPGEKIQALTLGAAEKLAVSRDLGSIEIGKCADFAVFEEDPLQKGRMPECIMTLIDGQIVYDAVNENMEEWYSVMSSQQF